jgi:hypothetical protein
VRVSPGGGKIEGMLKLVQVEHRSEARRGGGKREEKENDEPVKPARNDEAVPEEAAI